jgi:lantibiotic biosynthesis protein
MHQSSWTPTLPPALATRALGVACAVAEHLRDRQRVGLAVAVAPTQTAFPRTIGWLAPTLAQGDAGIALTCAYLDACLAEQGWDRIGHGYLTTAADGAERLPHLSAGMFGGLAGLAFAGWLLSREATRYRRLLATLDATLLPQVTMQAVGLTRLTMEGVSFGEFDVISGMAGVGAYLLLRRENPDSAVALDAALCSLVSLGSDTGSRPRWWTPAHLLGDEEMAALYPYGNLNCGLAHGIPGPLALMALALSHGIAVPGIEEAVDRLADWLVGHRADDGWGVNWPYAVSLTHEGLPDLGASPEASSRAAWCYGAPGVARALWLAGMARKRPEWRNLAVEAMEAVYRRPIAARRIDSPTFCHGVAGLLQVTWRFANDTRLPVFAEAAASLTEGLLSAYEPDSLLGYRNWEPGGTRVDQPGLLDGAPGVLLALLAASTDVEPSWDRAFLLS